MSTKKKIYILLSIIVILITIYTLPIYLEYRAYTIKDIKYEDGLAYFHQRIQKSNPSLLNKKYFYFSAWNTKCKPCIKEMPLQDDLADSLSKNIGFVYISDDSDKNINSFLKRKGIISRNFIFMNDMNTFISAIHKKQNITYKCYPTHIVTDSVGNILFFKQGAISYIELSKNRKYTEKELSIKDKFKDPLILFLKTLK
jgi:thiol-disulfide isomerase/thioredoxin